MFKKTFKEIAVNTFTPLTYEEELCFEIAKALGEENMNFVLSAYKKCGINAVKRAFDITEEANNVQDKRRYFNKIISIKGG